MGREELVVDATLLIGKTIKQLHKGCGYSVGVEFTDDTYCVVDKGHYAGIQLMPPWDIAPQMQIELGMATLEDFEEEAKRREENERLKYLELHAKYGGE